METRRLHVLVEFARLGSMRAVADALGTTTSTVSQQLAALANEAGTALIEPDGRRARLTPAGRRLTEHAMKILAAVEAARVDLDPAAEPAGVLRVAGFATAIRESLLPVVTELASNHPRVRLLINEHEPARAFELLKTDDVDLALTYDYNLAPATVDRTIESTPLWASPWGLGVPTRQATGMNGAAPAIFRRFRDHDWIVDSRNTADETVIRTIASMAGFEPRVTHQADSLNLVQDLIVAGLGVGLLPASQPTLPGVSLLPLTSPDVELRSYASTRHGREQWPPLELVMRLLSTAHLAR